jgi:hypothetical protein
VSAAATAFLCDDDNDLPLAAVVGKAFLPSVSAVREGVGVSGQPTWRMERTHLEMLGHTSLDRPLTNLCVLCLPVTGCPAVCKHPRRQVLRQRLRQTQTGLWLQTSSGREGQSRCWMRCSSLCWESVGARSSSRRRGTRRVQNL